MTTWTPDTCDCVMVFQPTGPETVEVVEVKRRCRFHFAPGEAEHFNEVLGENRRKNRGVSAVVKVLGSRGINEDNLVWRIDEKRDVYFKVLDRGLTTREQNDVRAELATVDARLKIE